MQYSIVTELTLVGFRILANFKLAAVDLNQRIKVSTIISRLAIFAGYLIAIGYKAVRVGVKWQPLLPCFIV
jgi:hypothetical protein